MNDICMYANQALLGIIKQEPFNDVITCLLTALIMHVRCTLHDFYTYLQQRHSFFENLILETEKKLIEGQPSNMNHPFY
jgi:hypothetical protein